MKYKKIKYLLLPVVAMLILPKSVLAISYNEIDTSTLINFNAIFQIGAVMNDTSNSSNLNIVIGGMIVIILILIGTAMFAPKK